QGLERVLGLSGHRGDRHGFGHAFLHEQGSDEVPRGEIGLADQRSERGCSAHPARPAPKGIGHRDGCYRGASARSTAPTRPSTVCGFATACTRRPCSRASRAVTGPMHTTFGLPLTTPIARTNPRTVEALVKVTASTPPERSAVRASGGSERGIRVRYASTRVVLHPLRASAS